MVEPGHQGLVWPKLRDNSTRECGRRRWRARRRPQANRPVGSPRRESIAGVEAAARITDEYEIVMSTMVHRTIRLRCACALANADGRIRVVELSRNFGHHKALMAGSTMRAASFAS